MGYTKDVTNDSTMDNTQDVTVDDTRASAADKDNVRAIFAITDRDSCLKLEDIGGSSQQAPDGFIDHLDG